MSLIELELKLDILARSGVLSTIYCVGSVKIWNGPSFQVSPRHDSWEGRNKFQGVSYLLSAVLCKADQLEVFGKESEPEITQKDG